MKKIMLSASALVLAAMAAAPAQAAFVNAPVPTNATLIVGGLQWAWASPLAAYSVDLSY
jgi:hypothetical protein